MKIACLGWGSLIWCPKSIPIRGKWFEDGPNIPIEFARESSDGRITLVVTDMEYQVRSLWALMSSKTLDDAKKALAARERIKDKLIKESIGFWDRESDKSHGLCADDIKAWAIHLKLDGVVWTNLKFGLKAKRGIMPDYSEVIAHLRALSHESRKVAEEYICRAPIQIDTEYRRKIQADLGWKPSNSENA